MGEKKWCRGTESNCRHHDFQSCVNASHTWSQPVFIDRKFPEWSPMSARDGRMATNGHTGDESLRLTRVRGVPQCEREEVEALFRLRSFRRPSVFQLLMSTHSSVEMYAVVRCAGGEAEIVTEPRLSLPGSGAQDWSGSATETPSFRTPAQPRTATHTGRPRTNTVTTAPSPCSRHPTDGDRC